MTKYHKSLVEMSKTIKFPSIFSFSAKQEKSIFFFTAAVFITALVLFSLFTQKTEANLSSDIMNDIFGKERLTFLEKNTLIPMSGLVGPEFKVIRKIPVVITAYSSTPEETDSTPFITAAGTQVRNGIVANNYFPFGTKIKIPELYGEKIFTVEDRMSWKKGNYQFDIWFPSHQEAEKFGAERTYIEIVEG